MRVQRFVARAAVVGVVVLLAGVLAGSSQAKPASSKASVDRLAPSFLKDKPTGYLSIGPRGAGTKGLPSAGLAGLLASGLAGASSNAPGCPSTPGFLGIPISGISSIQSWCEAAPTTPDGFSFWNTVGTPPTTTGTTAFPAPVVPVIVSLRNADGSQRYVDGQPLISDPSQYVQPSLSSPVFSKSNWSSSSTPAQLPDAVQRAEYWGREQNNWHTMLSPTVRAPLQMNLPRGTYRFALNPDGSCCAFILVDAQTFQNLLFPPSYPVDNSTVMGQAELNGDINTKSISTFLFPNTYLYFNGDPNNCCVLGFHTFDYEPGTQSSGGMPRGYVMNYSSWISPGLFGDAFTDVTALSHEMSELFNDPFVGAFGDNATPWWLAPNGVCQNNRETGDVIEGLADATYPITMNGFTYHPQNEALLSWFAFQTPSTAIDGAYSYPDENVLTGAPTPQNPGCA